MANAYLTNVVTNAVIVIDTVNDNILYPTTGIAVGTDPIGVAITPDGLKAFIVNANASSASGSVSVIDTVHGAVIQTISLSGYGQDPQGIAIGTTSNGVYAYVTVYDSGTIVVIDTVSYSIVTTISLPAGVQHPLGVAITPNGNYVYIANNGGGTSLIPGAVTIITTSSNTIWTSFALSPFSTFPNGVAITPNSSTVYVTQGGASGNIVAFFAAASASPTISTVTVGFNPQGVAITPDGSTVYVVNTNDHTVSYFPTGASPSVTTISSSSFNNPVGVAITPDGSKVYVANDGNNTVSVINTTTHGVTTISGSGGSSFGIFIQPNQSSTSAFGGVSTSWFGC